MLHQTDQNELSHVVHVSKVKIERFKSRESFDRNAPPPRKIAGSLFIRAYTLFEFSQTKRFPRFYNEIHKYKSFINIIIVYASKLIFG